MKRAIIKNFNAHAHHYFSEFHSVAVSFQRDGGDTEIAVEYIEKIKV